jgi:hypothetical protein
MAGNCHALVASDDHRVNPHHASNCVDKWTARVTGSKVHVAAHNGDRFTPTARDSGPKAADNTCGYKAALAPRMTDGKYKLANT